MAANNTVPITIPINAACEALLKTNGNSTVPLKGNPDIAGIGVVSSFIASASTCLFIAIWCYVLGLLPDTLLNDYDREFMHLRSRAKERWFEALRNGMMAFSDSQILQGVAILVAGFANVGSLTVYHWQLVVYMAWMSSNVHLTTLAFLREYLHKHPGLLVVRVTGMLILLVLLMVAFVPTSSRNWIFAVTQAFDRNNYPTMTHSGLMTDDHWYFLNFAMPVKCFWHSPFNGRDVPEDSLLSDSINYDAPFTYLLLIVSYVWKVTSLLKAPHHYVSGKGTTSQKGRRLQQAWFKRRVLGWLLYRTKRHAHQVHTARLERRKLGGRLSQGPKLVGSELAFRLALITYAGGLAAYDFLASFMASMWILTLLFIWGTLEIVNVRNKALGEVHEEEKRWGFGQVLPVVLLAAPLIATANHFIRNMHHGTSPEIQDIWHPLRGMFQKKSSKTTDEEATRPKFQRSRSGTSSSSHLPILHSTAYEPFEEETDVPSPAHQDSLVDYILNTEEPDQTVIALEYFYKSWVFRFFLLLPNIVCIFGGAWLFSFEGRSASDHEQQLKKQGGVAVHDPKGGVFIIVALPVAIGFAVWVFWAAIGMWASRVFWKRK